MGASPTGPWSIFEQYPWYVTVSNTLEDGHYWIRVTAANDDGDPIAPYSEALKIDI